MIKAKIYFTGSYNGTNDAGETMIPSGVTYSVFYLFVENFGLTFTMTEEKNRCSITNETSFSGGCKHVIGNTDFKFSGQSRGSVSSVRPNSMKGGLIKVS